MFGLVKPGKNGWSVRLLPKLTNWKSRTLIVSGPTGKVKVFQNYWANCTSKFYFPSAHPTYSTSVLGVHSRTSCLEYIALRYFCKMVYRLRDWFASSANGKLVNHGKEFHSRLYHKFWIWRTDHFLADLLVYGSITNLLLPGWSISIVSECICMVCSSMLFAAREKGALTPTTNMVCNYVSRITLDDKKY